MNYLKALWKSILASIFGDQSATKHILKSKTFWVNLLTLLATLSGYLPATWTAILLPVANIGLRIVTTQGITFFEE